MVSSNRKLVLGSIGGVYLLGLPMLYVAFRALLRYEGQGGALAALSLRDFSMCVALWALSGVFLTFFVRRQVDRASRQLCNVLRRVAEGDWTTPLPTLSDPVLEEALSLVGKGVSLFEARDAARREHLGDARGLIGRLLELGTSPVLVIGIHGGGRLTLDYANEKTSEAFGESLEGRGGTSLEEVPGADALRALVETLLESGNAHFHTTLGENHALLSEQVVDCAVVRNPVGMPTRLVVVLREGSDKAWWRRLWAGAMGFNQGNV